MVFFRMVRDLVNWYRHNPDAKEFTTYIAFVVIFSVIAFAGTPGDIQYHLNGYARSSLNFDENGQNGAVNVMDVSDMGTLDTWLRTSLPDLIFPQETYDGNPLSSIQRLYLVGEGRGMGAVRVRNVRGPFRVCDTPAWLTEVNGQTVNCTADIGISNYVTESYAERDDYSGNLPDGMNFTKPFTFQSRGELNTTFFAHIGEYGVYPQDGYTLDVIPNVSPDILADKVQQCRPLLEKSILECMRNQSVEFDPPASPPPPVYTVPQPPPLQLGTADTAGMVLTSATGGVDTFIMELSKSFELGESRRTDSYTFRIHNPGKVALQWKFDDPTKGLFSSTSWIDGAPNQIDGVVDAATVVLSTQSQTTGTDITIKVKTGSTYSNLPANSPPRDGVGNPGNVTLFIRSAQNDALVAAVTLFMKYKLTPLAAVVAPAPAASPSANGTGTNATNATATGRKLLQAAAPAPSPAPAPSSAPSVESLLNPAPPQTAAQKCTETTGAIDLNNLPSGLNVSRCSMVRDVMRECQFPYLGFHHLLELSKPEQCGQCKCKSDVDEGCLTSCSSKSIYDQQAEMLKKHAWMDRQTRGVLVDMTVLHQNSNLFQSIRVLFEFPSFGGIVPKADVRTFRLYRYVTSHDNLIMGLEIIFCIMLLWYTIEELLEFRKNKMEYMSNAWNILDWINLVVFYVVVGLRVGALIYTDGFDYNSVTVEYVDFQPIGFALVQELNVVSINFFLMYFKVFKYLSKVPRMDSILLTVSTCSFDLFLFFIMFGIIMFGFTAAFYMVFGPYLSDYRTLGTCFSTLFRVLLGDFDYGSLVEVNPTMAVLLFYSFILMGFMLLMNMLLAIVCDSFADVKGNQTEEDLNFYLNLRDKLSAKAKQLFSRNKELNAITASLKAGDGNMDNLIDESELEEALRHNPRAYEILKATGAKELLKKYDVDGNGVLDPEEMTAILKDIAEKESEILKEIKATEEAAAGAGDKGGGGRRGGGGGGGGGGGYGPPAEVDLTQVNERLDKVEGQIKEMSRNVAKKLALMIDLMMSLSDQISNVSSSGPGNHQSMGGAMVPGGM
mmetsp:Transcript_18756/g.46699  ORF Transcript_18756/g.46699 Transcript_18756/m.46699 type:complete len:1062 (+) Transcript_18756:270-3455(+)